jgi:hypothetical protein
MKVGAVGVDSGRIMLLDPCNEGKRTGDAAIGSLSPAIDGVRSIRRGSVEIGIMAQTPGGDGVFPVIAEVVDGKLNGLLLDFGDEDLERGILAARDLARNTVEATIVESPDPSQIGRTGRVPLEGTAAAIVDRGWPATRISDVSSRAALSRRTFYEQFGTLDALAATMVSEALTTDLLDGLSPRSGLYAVAVEILAERLADGDPWTSLLANKALRAVSALTTAFEARS